MNSAILFIDRSYEADLSKTMVFDKHLIDHTVSQIKRLDVEAIYLVGDLRADDVIKRDNLNEVFEELRDVDGKCILISPFYPLIEKEDYERLLNVENNAVFVRNEEDIIPVFAIYNSLLSSYDKLSYEAVDLDEEKARRFNSLKDLPDFQEIIRNKVNSRWMEKGVVITDPKTCIIGTDVFIDKNTVIHPNTIITGKTIIGKNDFIGANSRLHNVVMGDENIIEDSIVNDSVIHNGTKVGPKTVMEGSELFDEVKVGSFVKLEDTKLGAYSSVDHLTFLGDCQTGEHVHIGSGVITVNFDGRSRHATNIKSHSTIGSNVSLIAPINIGEYAMVASGSTIDSDIKDGDMAIARIYQQNKKGYGYKYNKED